MENQASLQLCNLVARGKTMAEARQILGLGAEESSSPAATVGTGTAVGASAAGGEPPQAPAPETPPAPPAPVDPPPAPSEPGAKPAWMP